MAGVSRPSSPTPRVSDLSRKSITGSLARKQMQSRMREHGARAIRLVSLPLLCFVAVSAAPIAWADGPQRSPSIFAPASTPASSIQDLSWFVLAITGGIFVTVGGLLAWAMFRYRERKTDDDSEPPQIYGSTQVELAWTVIPILIVVVLFLTTARIIFAIQDAPKPQDALDVTVVGHQFWWEFRYPKLGIVTANELHVPVSSAQEPRPTYLHLLSADVDHSFWVPQLAGKTDLIPNHPNETWIDPRHTGLVSGAVRAVLRRGAREDAAARVRGYAGAVCGVGEGAAAAGMQDPAWRRGGTFSKRKPAPIATPSQARRRRARLGRT